MVNNFYCNQKTIAPEQYACSPHKKLNTRQREAFGISTEERTMGG